MRSWPRASCIGKCLFETLLRRSRGGERHRTEAFRSSSTARSLALVASLAAIACQSPGPLDGSHDIVTGPDGLMLRVQVESVRDQRFHNVVSQTLDYSCGAAAMATLLRYHYDDPVTEPEIVREMVQNGDREKIRREGFSLLDLKKYSQRRGYETKGFSIGPEMLERLAIPSITLVHTRGFSHFVVLKGARGGIVYLADPALGQRNLTTDEFVAEWDKVVFFVAAKRSGDKPSPLAVLSSLAPAPMHLIDELDLQSIGSRLPLSVREF